MTKVSVAASRARPATTARCAAPGAEVAAIGQGHARAGWPRRGRRPGRASSRPTGGAGRDVGEQVVERRIHIGSCSSSRKAAQPRHRRARRRCRVVRSRKRRRLSSVRARVRYARAQVAQLRPALAEAWASAHAVRRPGGSRAERGRRRTTAAMHSSHVGPGRRRRGRGMSAPGRGRRRRRRRASGTSKGRATDMAAASCWVVRSRTRRSPSRERIRPRRAPCRVEWWAARRAR